MMGGSGGPPQINLPTFDELVNTVVDVAAASATWGYTLTEPGKKDLDKAKKGVKQFSDSITGVTARESGERAEQKAVADQTKREADIDEQDLKRKRSSEFSSIRARQRANSGMGRSSTILTGPSAVAPQGATLGSSQSGKTRLGL